jgi:hypothetical protein
VIVDALEVLRFDAEPAEISRSLQFFGDLPHYILDKTRTLESLLGDKLLIFTLEEGVDLAGAGLLYDTDDVLDPKELVE